LKKRQWRMLMTELLEARNEASAAHAYIENQVEALRQRLLVIERRLPPEPVDLEAVSSDDGQQPLPDAIDYSALRWRTQNEDGTWRDCID